MAEKTLFPQYWVNLKESVILENLKYLNDHFSQYDVKLDDPWLKLHNGKDPDIDIAFYDIEQYGQKIHAAKVNGKILRNDKNPELYNEAKALYNKSTKKKDLSQTKVEKTKKDNNGKFFTTLVVVVCAIVFEAGLVVSIIRRQNREKQEKIEFAKELLKTYEAERAKGAVNIDSLVNQHVR